MEDQVEIFFSYAPEDERLCEQLEAHLSFLKWQGLAISWHRRNISAGAEWEHEIDQHLNAADIILLLISSDFMHSTYCFSKEMMRAMERHEAGEACVIPVLLRPVYWWTAPFSKLHALPTNGKPVVSGIWHSSDEAFEEIARGICKVIEKLTQKSLENPFLSARKSPDRDNEIAKIPSGKDALQIDLTADTSSLCPGEAYAASKPQILTPSLIILLGGTAAITGLELMQQMLTLSQTDRDRVRFVFIRVEAPSYSYV